MISTKRYFVQNSRLPFEENTKMEFKNHHSISIEEMKGARIPKLAPISQTICGFLNQGEGGVILLGIHDSGYVRGIELTPPEMEHLNYSILDTISRFNPPVETDAVQIEFIPVSPYELVNNKKDFFDKVKHWYANFEKFIDEDDDERPHEFRKALDKCWCGKEKRRLVENSEFVQKWIVQLTIGTPKGLSASFSEDIKDVSEFRASLMYENEESVAFLRLDGGNRRMAPFDISRHINEQVRDHYQPIIDRLRAQIDKKLELLNIPTELKETTLDSHEGMKRHMGHVIQPNLDRACNPSTV